MYTNATCSVPASVSSGAGAMVSNSKDMSKWLYHLYTNKNNILSESSFKTLKSLNQKHVTGGVFLDLEYYLEYFKSEGICDTVPNVKLG